MDKYTYQEDKTRTRLLYEAYKLIKGNLQGFKDLDCDQLSKYIYLGDDDVQADVETIILWMNQWVAKYDLLIDEARDRPQDTDSAEPDGGTFDSGFNSGYDSGYKEGAKRANSVIIAATDIIKTWEDQ